ncbi:hypothetical protein ACKXGF_07765 [Alkalibacillus sp. S2W]|uniref:hypothetical protein n=1 Tax=Alkalibacillus sp. S2W TaxID=3386553 RepID=UPI00398CB5C9
MTIKTERKRKLVHKTHGFVHRISNVMPTEGYMTKKDVKEPKVEVKSEKNKMQLQLPRHNFKTVEEEMYIEALYQAGFNYAQACFNVLYAIEHEKGQQELNKRKMHVRKAEEKYMETLDLYITGLELELAEAEEEEREARRN